MRGQAVAAASDYPNLQIVSSASQRVIALGVVVAVCYYAQAVVITFFCSLLCAFLLEPVVGLLVGWRFPRGLAAFLVCLLAVALLYLVGGLFYTRSVAFLQELPRYETTIKETVEKVRQRVQNLEATFMRFMPQERQQQIVQAIETRRPRARARQEPPPPPPVAEVRLKDESGLLTRYVFPQLRIFYQFLLLASFIPFLVYFMLSWKDHMRHGFVNLFRLENRHAVHSTLNGIGAMVRAFLVGNFLLAVLLASLSALIFWFLRIPFPFMMGTISGLLSVIPYVGLPLAMAPPLFASLGVYTSISSLVVILSSVAGLHLLAMNVFYPKLVGSRLHLNPLTLTVAIMVWGWMWGAIGLLLAVPITAGVKAVCDNVPSLNAYGQLLGD
ncbi:MAG: AI-2E family transporter [Acidobacteria bacterium]|nr:AI-2E family transporter [Acidobacteriota bacterium]